MIPKTYTVVLENSATGVVRRFTLRLRPVVAGLILAFTLPILFAFAVRWSAEAELQVLRDAAQTAEVENASYRAATAELTGQIGALQDSIADLSKQSSLDPATAKALANLPALTRNRAVGGAAGTAAVRAALSPAFVGPEDTFGILRELLGRMEDKLQFVRTRVKARSVLAAATPTIWPVHGWLSARFGHRDDPFGAGQALHTGIDISAEKGTPVRATAAGTVETASYNGAYGNLLVIDHGFGMMTRYAHLSGFTVKPGEHVERNAVVGFVGATGRATGAHLHYEVLLNGNLIDPMQWIAGSPRQ